jgi:hypothetical protein
VSTFLDQDITCRSCGQSWVRPVATFLDAPPDLDRARAELQQDRFQRFACPGCGQRAIAARPLRWCDRQARLWVAMLPDAAERQWPRWERDVRTMAAWDIAQDGTDTTDLSGWTLRLVFGLLALREKLIAHQEDLDDASLEVMKLELLDAHPDLERKASHRLRLADAGENLLSFAARDDRGRWQGAAATRARLAAIHADPGLQAEARAAVVAGPYVDLGRMLVELPDGSGRDLR